MRCWSQHTCGGADGCETCVYVNGYNPNRGAGQDAVQILDQSTSDAMKQSATDLTITEAQGAEGWAGCKLIAKFSIADPDDPAKIYTFDTSGAFVRLSYKSSAFVVRAQMCFERPRCFADCSTAWW